jgi:hypothetical protein
MPEQEAEVSEQKSLINCMRAALKQHVAAIKFRHST